MVKSSEAVNIIGMEKGGEGKGREGREREGKGGEGRGGEGKMQGGEVRHCLHYCLRGEALFEVY